MQKLEFLRLELCNAYPNATEDEIEALHADLCEIIKDTEMSIEGVLSVINEYELHSDIELEDTKVDDILEIIIDALEDNKVNAERLHYFTIHNSPVYSIIAKLCLYNSDHLSIEQNKALIPIVKDFGFTWNEKNESWDFSLDIT